MPFFVQYYRRDKMICETRWDTDIPPSCRFIRSNLAVHDADRALVLDDMGFELIVEERQKFDA